ncbi:DNA repair protein XRCC3-like [Lycorma delicatula]|uniref:DNA repair protein XRCC3-like n=1 Tax=Lycorma delicatula TaxID=130591 RepID=UPI003F51039A
MHPNLPWENITFMFLQLNTLCIIQPLDQGAVYICTEDKFPFPSPRLQQLFTTFPLSTHEDKKKLGDNVFIEHIADVDGLKQCVMTQLPHLLTRQSIGLVVIDSITAVFRADYMINIIWLQGQKIFVLSVCSSIHWQINSMYLYYVLTRLVLSSNKTTIVDQY